MKFSIDFNWKELKQIDLRFENQTLLKEHYPMMTSKNGEYSPKQRLIHHRVTNVSLSNTFKFLIDII